MSWEFAQVKHAILLTDGRNEDQTPEEFRRILDSCRGRFVCDALGVGDDWDAGVLQEIADVLLGSATGLPDPSGLAAEFRSIAESLMGRSVADVSLRVRTPRNGRVRLLKQVYPRVVDLTDRGTAVSDQIMDYPTGHWGSETREFHLSVDVPAGTGTVGDEVLVARVSVIADARESNVALVLAHWTEDLALSARIDAKVAHYSAQTDLAAAIVEGLAALDADDVAVATARLGRAVQLADQFRRADIIARLSRLVDVVDAPTGTVRLRPGTHGADLELRIGVGEVRLWASEIPDLEQRLARWVRESRDAARTQEERVRESLARRQDTLAGEHVEPGQGQPVVDDPPDLVGARAHTLAVSVYVADDEGYQRVERALEGVLDAFELEITQRYPEIRGSWYRAFIARTKRVFTSEEMKAGLTKLERAIELQTLHRAQAEVDAAQSGAVAELLKALDGTPHAIIQIGSILLIKVDGVPSVRNLTQLELAHLERNPAVFGDPAAALRELQRINHEIPQIPRYRPVSE
jgi:VWA domain-containing protein